MSAKLKKVTDKYYMYRLTLTCGCTPTFRICPPQLGDVITCYSHGEATVIGKVKAGE